MEQIERDVVRTHPDMHFFTGETEDAEEHRRVRAGFIGAWGLCVWCVFVCFVWVCVCVCVCVRARAGGSKAACPHLPGSGRRRWRLPASDLRPPSTLALHPRPTPHPIPRTTHAHTTPGDETRPLPLRQAQPRAALHSGAPPGEATT